MDNKCPNCGFEYGDNDAYCAMCGVKIARDEVNVEVEIEDDELSDSTDFMSQNLPLFDYKEEEKKSKKKFNFKSGLFDNAMINFIGVMIAISLLLCFCLYIVIKSQEYKKLQLRYDNMIANPAQIPELKEPKTFLELKTNLANNENFLSLYLKYSKDALPKKEQIFISYLKEMDKLPHITNENLVNDDLDACSTIKSSVHAKKCAKQFTRDFKNVGIAAYSDHNVVYLYPDYKFIYNKYAHYLSPQMSAYLKLKAKYSIPLRAGLELQVKPKKIADKIYDFERLYSRISDVYIRDEVLKTIYNDLRIFLFTPSIYNTTTQEMTKEFKKAYNYFISMRKNSQLRPIIMSYMDKMRSYDETNFRNDYPYKIFEDTFDDNVENSSLSDIFAQLRKTYIATNSEISFSYIYTISGGVWRKYESQSNLSQSEFVISTVDENNNISIYNNTFSLMQELNIPKYSKLFLSNGGLYVYNADRLAISKIIYNGTSFILQLLNVSDATTIFPGIKVVIIDSLQNYNIYLEKDTFKASYILLSRYSQGFEGYSIAALKGSFIPLGLPNMFTISGYDDVELSFHGNSVNPNETSDSAPTYKITIHSRGYETQDEVVNYDEKTAQEQPEETHNPTIMPKIMDKETEQKPEIESLQLAPSQNLEPPKEQD